MKLDKLTNGLENILQTIEANEGNINNVTHNIHDNYKLSAKNLCRYLILRTFDLRKFQENLSEIGVSSIRTSEGYVYSNIFNVVRNLKLLQGLPKTEPSTIELIGYKKSKKLVKKNANALFKRARTKHFAEIMVTLPKNAAKDKSVIRDMAENGMEIARINLGHGKLKDWMQMVTYIKEINNQTNYNIKIYMDLSGPKFRTSTIEILKDDGKIGNSIPIKKGDHIILTKRTTKGKRSKFDNTNTQIEKAEIGVMLHEIIDDIKVEDVVFFDDGMIKAQVLSKTEQDVELLITDCYKSKLSSEKGINLPHTKYKLPALTEQDIKNLPFVCEYADMVGYSFVRDKEDVSFLFQQLHLHGAKDLGVIFKIENVEAFENLPEILLEGMKHNKIGVMIARGDLAVEVGFERISEVQNQILWICEAAHIPVIWATQVLENLAKTGIPTRAEISDATQGAYAECVMLNKGPYINNAIKTLENILIRMESNSFKRKNALRPLNIAKKSTDKLFNA
ncbi:pyruvate kinase [Winogradskyella vidalii]|uniref:pyruvate kinase n=1 Tax=Winogradskyella vidalii TaxID=2615024 RepID=UPI0015C6FE0A|nr:pyruvate kinase [Winogradskyella vidalii]